MTQQAEATERTVLGAILASGDFAREPHRRIFGAMTALSSRDESIDLVTLAGELGQSAALDAVGGIAYLAGLVLPRDGPKAEILRGESARKVAEAIGIHWTYLSMILRGKRRPSLDVALRLARHAGLTVEQLVDVLPRRRA